MNFLKNYWWVLLLVIAAVGYWYYTEQAKKKAVAVNPAGGPGCWTLPNNLTDAPLYGGITGNTPDPVLNAVS